MVGFNGIMSAVTRRAFPVVWVLLLLAAAGLFKACGDDDVSNTDITGVDGFVPETIVVTSDALADGESVPVRFTCEGENLSPPLRWTAGPTVTESYVVIVDDPDAPGRTFLHWLVYAIPADVTWLPQGVPPVTEDDDSASDDEVRQGINDFGDRGYGGPCPPEGDAPHAYRFQVLAIDEEVGVSNGAPIATVMAAIEDHVIAQGTLTATFGR